MPSDSTLLVPIDVRALVCAAGAADAEWAEITPGYRRLDQGVTLGDQLAPAPFTIRSRPPEPGVHLHWAMPDALTHGRQLPDGETEFPPLPNRWLIARMWREGEQVRARTWALISDALSAQDPGGSTPWPVEQDGTYRCEYLGKRLEAGRLADADEKESGEVFLTAVGPGDPLFAASYWSCRNVFGMHDALADLPRGNGAGGLSYLVIGWWSAPRAEPFAGVADWRRRLHELRWSLPAGAPDAPERTLLHGLVHGVRWDGPDATGPTGIPQGEVQLSIGNTTNEALAALVAAHVPDRPDAERLLEAFLDGLMPQLEGPDGLIALEEQLHRLEFAPYGGSERHRLVPLSQGAVGAGARARALQPLPEALGDGLAALLTLEGERDRLGSELAGQRQLLYATWHKKAQLDQSPWPTRPTAAAVSRYIVDHLLAAVQTTEQKLAAHEAQLGAAVVALQDAVNADGRYELQTEPAERFWQPHPPVVVVSGDGVRRSPRHGQDGRFSNDGTLGCRLAGTTVSGLRAPPSHGLALQVQRSDIEAQTDSAPLPPGLREVARELVIEAVALSPQLLAALVPGAWRRAGTPRPSPDRLRRGEAALGAPQSRLGRSPSPAGVVEWSPPWTPLLLQWEADWHPTATTPAKALDGWELGEIDFHWQGAAPDLRRLRRFVGQVPVDPATSVRLSAQIARYVNDHPDDPNRAALEKLARSSGTLDVISQSLSGFDWSLIGTVQTLQMPVIDPVDPSLGRLVAEHVGAADEITPDPSGSFDPVRAGHLLLTRVAMIDTFGQIKSAGVAAEPAPIVAEPLRSATGSQFAQLPPRVTQPCRLRFEWAPSSDQHRDRATNDDPATTPVAGWLLPNHIDASVMLFDPVGTLLGELQLIDGALDPSGPGVRWLPAAGTPQTLGVPPTFPNDPTLQGFTNGLLASGMAGQHALRDLLGVIDETLPSVDPHGSWQNQSLSILVGRPLALARATLRVELSGLPAYAQGWDGLRWLLDTSELPTEGFTGVKLPVMLGDTRRLLDGLIGFFVDDDFGTFHLARYGASPPVSSSYVKPNAPLHVVPDPTVPAVEVVLVLDPRAAVHATSAWLPTDELALSPDFYTAAVAAMEVTFLTGPIVTDAANVAVPVPQAAGSWSWLSIDSAGTWHEVGDIAPVTPKAALDAAPQSLVDGWLKVTGALHGRAGSNGGGNGR